MIAEFVSLDNKKKLVRTGEENPAFKRLKSRRKAKAITHHVTKKLLGLNSPLHKEYVRAHLCQGFLFQNGKKMVSPYCKSKVCRVCNRIRSAQLMAGYSKPLLSLDEIYLVTLTTPNVPEPELWHELAFMQGSWRRILDNVRKRYPSIHLVGLRKLECTYNYRSDTYNPHYHVIMNSKEAAELLQSLWLDQFPKANMKGQDVRKANENALYELFKYVTKDTVSGNFKPKALDVMYTALRGKNTIYPFGGIRKVSEEMEQELESFMIEHKGERKEVWKWMTEFEDWMSPTGEMFVGSDIDRKTENLIKTINRHDDKEEEKERNRIKTWEEITTKHRERKEILF